MDLTQQGALCIIPSDMISRHLPLLLFWLLPALLLLAQWTLSLGKIAVPWLLLSILSLIIPLLAWALYKGKTSRRQSGLVLILFHLSLQLNILLANTAENPTPAILVGSIASLIILGLWSLLSVVRSLCYALSARTRQLLRSGSTLCVAALLLWASLSIFTFNTSESCEYHTMEALQIILPYLLAPAMLCLLIATCRCGQAELFQMLGSALLWPVFVGLASGICGHETYGEHTSLYLLFLIACTCLPVAIPSPTATREQGVPRSILLYIALTPLWLMLLSLMMQNLLPYVSPARA